MARSRAKKGKDKAAEEKGDASELDDDSVGKGKTNDHSGRPIAPIAV